MAPHGLRSASARTAARLLRPAAGVLLVVAACRLDDRTLTSENLDTSGELYGGVCGSSGANACQTCLYDRCCEQTQSCAAGSPCARYLSCVTGCNSEQACIDGCGIDEPTGFGDAVALSVCAGAQCTMCSEQTPARGCDPQGAGACQNADDCAALEAGALEALDVAVCPACDSDVLGAACQRCLADASGLSAGCSSCVAGWLSCIFDNCLLSCQDGANVEDCQRCTNGAGCTRELVACGFSG